MRFHTEESATSVLNCACVTLDRVVKTGDFMAHSVPGFPIVVLYMVSVSILRFYSFVVSWQVCNFPVFTWAVPDQWYRSEKHYLTSAAIKKKKSPTGVVWIVPDLIILLSGRPALSWTTALDEKKERLGTNFNSWGHPDPIFKSNTSLCCWRPRD